MIFTIPGNIMKPIGLLLELSTTTLGSPPIYIVIINNTTFGVDQDLSYTWKYVGQVGDIDATISYDGSNRSVGYTTPVINNTNNYAFGNPFTITGGNATTIEIEFTLLSASYDTVPSSPDDKISLFIPHNF